MAPRINFGLTDLCSIGLEPGLPGLVERDPTGFRLLGQDDQGCRLIFGPTMDCTVEVNPLGPDGLLLRDPRGIRILNPDPIGELRLRFGDTDLCQIRVPGAGQGMIFDDPDGIVVNDPTGIGGGTITLGEGSACRIRAVAGAGMIFEDPAGVEVRSPLTGEGVLRLGVGQCAIRAGGPSQGMFLLDPEGFRFDDPNTQPIGDGVVFAGAFVQTSSIRWKEHVRTIENALDLVRRLEGVRYDWNADMGGAADIGFIAEAVREVLPELVAVDDDGNPTGVNYGKVSAVAVQAIKEQQKQIEMLLAENDAMRARLDGMDSLRLQLEALSARVDDLHGVAAAR